jgi:hypothetical protein
MKVLVVTRTAQGRRLNDFCHAEEGELACFGSECSSGEADDACGCHRSFIGMKTRKGTTTAVVVDRPDLTQEDLEREVRVSLDRSGFLSLLAEEAEATVREEAAELARLAAQFTVGAVLEKRGDAVQVRLSSVGRDT